MYAVTSLAYSPPSPSTPEPSLASLIVPAQPVFGLLPAGQVAAPVAGVRVENQTQSNVFDFPSSDGASELITGQNSIAGTPAGGYIASFPTLFMAQLIAQNPGDSQTASVVASYQGIQVMGGPRYVREEVRSSQNPTDAFMQTLASDGANNNAAPATPANANTPLASVPQKPQPVYDLSSLPLFAAAGITSVATPRSPVKTENVANNKKPIHPETIGASLYAATVALFGMPSGVLEVA